jgi:hypothetical protein
LLKAFRQRNYNTAGPWVVTSETFNLAFNRDPEAVLGFCPSVPEAEQAKSETGRVGHITFDEAHHLALDNGLGSIALTLIEAGWGVHMNSATPIRADGKTMPPLELRHHFKRFRYLLYEHFSEIGIETVHQKIVEFDYPGHPLEQVFSHLDPETAQALIKVPSQGQAWRKEGSYFDTASVVDLAYSCATAKGFKPENLCDTVTQSAIRRQELAKARKPGNPDDYKIVLTNQFVAEGVDVGWLTDLHDTAPSRSPIQFGQLFGRTFRKEDDKTAISVTTYFPRFNEDPRDPSFYEERVHAHIVTSLADDLVPALAVIAYPAKNNRPSVAEAELDPGDVGLVPMREALGQHWLPIMEEITTNLLMLPFEKQTSQGICEMIREVVAPYEEDIVWNQDHTVAGLYQTLCLKIRKSRGEQIEDLPAARPVLDTKWMLTSDDFPHLQEGETFCGIEYTPANMRRMHIAMQTRSEKIFRDKWRATLSGAGVKAILVTLVPISRCSNVNVWRYTGPGSCRRSTNPCLMLSGSGRAR